MTKNKTATIKRLTTEESNPNIESWQEVGDARVMFMPMGSSAGDDMRQLAASQGIMGKAYVAYAEKSADIEETDKLIIDSTTYEVRGLKKYEGTHQVDHLQVLLEKKKE